MIYSQVTKIAADLLRDGYDPEYKRGIVNILAELFPIPEYSVSDRMRDIESDIDFWLN